ncbi:hypothetical protein GOV10_06440, partial [Candidatus Woesearchaeota archaeon]|nr:hypothetical protein [Candidatus Woesearchaeota archaeon]
IVLDTLAQNRQLIIFVSSKRAAESQAEKIAAKLELGENADILEKGVLKALSSPTKQCKRLARCVMKGSAFHHAGLPRAQRELIEDGFRSGDIKVICATPTLAAGVDLPAFRVVIRDVKRYGGRWGMTPIAVLEYEQMSGRAGRPGKDPWGEAVLIAKNNDASWLEDTFVRGEPEELLSKLAVEPVLRTYVLSLVAGGFIRDRVSLIDFFSQTFYAHQYGDLAKLEVILDKMIILLRQWNFLEDDGKVQDDFVSANDLSKNSNVLKATELGGRVAELYLDPYTA